MTKHMPGKHPNSLNALNVGNPKYDIVFNDARHVDGKEYMRCIKCNGLMSEVKDTRAAELDGRKGIGRTRRCTECGHKWRTIELTIEELDKDV